VFDHAKDAHFTVTGDTLKRSECARAFAAAGKREDVAAAFVPSQTSALG